MAPRVVGQDRGAVVGVEEFLGGAAPGGEVGPRHIAEDGDDVVEGHVGDGFGGGACAVAVDDAWEVGGECELARGFPCRLH